MRMHSNHGGNERGEGGRGVQGGWSVQGERGVQGGAAGD